MSVNAAYPDTPRAREQWVLARRAAKNPLDPWTPYGFFHEDERAASGDMLPTATVLLTNRECPFRCLMCDLWRNTLDERVPRGAIAAQIRHALERLPPARQIKLYNAGSFFDPQAIPLEDYGEIAKAVAGFERVIVECHPKLVGSRTWQFQALLRGTLEVALGLETIHPDALARLNKRFTLDDFRRAADLLAQHRAALRVFLLLCPPFLSEAEGVEWAQKSLLEAFSCGATACVVIPTRGGSGAMEALAARGEFSPPRLRSLEAVQEFGIGLRQGRVFADLWDVERFFTCACSPERAARLAQMNITQSVPPPVVCGLCEGFSHG